MSGPAHRGLLKQYAEIHGLDVLAYRLMSRQDADQVKALVFGDASGFSRE